MSEKWEEELKTIWDNIINRPFKVEDTEIYLEKYKNTWQKKLKKEIISYEEYYKPGEKENLVYFISNDDYIGGIRFPKINWLYGGENDLKASGLEEHLETNTDYKKYLELIQRCLNKKDSEEFDEIINDKSCKYSAQNFLRKLIIVDQYSQGKYDYFAIFSNDTLDFLYTEIFGEKYKKEKFFEINKKIFAEVKNVCPKSSNMNDLEYNLKLMWGLWQMATDTEKEFPTENTPNVIFYGAPGTGKTYIVKKYLTTILGNKYEKNVYWVQFHPSYTYEDFIEGVKPVGIKDGILNLRLMNGQFKEWCKKAKEKPEEVFYFVADEINRANLSAVFGETLSIMEADYRDDVNSEQRNNLINTQYSQLEIASAQTEDDKKELFYDLKNPGKLGIPKNLYFIGIMNDVDKSIDTFDIALRRRFKWIRKDCDYDVILSVLTGEHDDSDKYPILFEESIIEKYIRSCKRLNFFISGVKDAEKDKDVYFDDIKETLALEKSFEFGHSNFLRIEEIFNNKEKNKKSKIDKDDCEKLFNQYLKPTLKEYLRGFVESQQIEDKIKTACEIFSNIDNSDTKDNVKQKIQNKKSK